MKHMNKMNRTSLLTVLAVVAAVATPAAFAGDCYRAQITETMLLPDGSLAHGGQVKVCRVKQLTPASTLHSLTIADRDLGLFMGSRRGVEAAETAAPPMFLFARTTTSSALEFRAVAYSIDGRYQAFQADRIGRGHGGRVLTQDAFALALAHDPGSTLVAFAAAD